MKLLFRPHHFLCSLGFRGKGYSDRFVANFQMIVDQLKENDDLEILVTEHTDSICNPCPNRQDLSCTQEEKITKLDHAHARALKLSAGDRLTWGEAKQRIKKYVDLKVFDEICKGCSWKPLGVCESALRELRDQTPH